MMTVISQLRDTLPILTGGEIKNLGSRVLSVSRGTYYCTVAHVVHYGFSGRIKIVFHPTKEVGTYRKFSMYGTVALGRQGVNVVERILGSVFRV